MLALLGLLGLAVLFGVGLLGYLLAQAQDDTTAAVDGTETQADGADSQLGSQEVAGDNDTDNGTGTDTETDTGTAAGTDTETDTAAGTDTESSDDSNGETVTVDVDGSAEDEAGSESEDEDGTDDSAGTAQDGDRQAVLRDGKVYLTGAVPSVEVGEQIAAKAAAVIGPDNVVNEYTIDPTVEIRPNDSAPLYIEDVVLFEFNSVEIADPFLPILDLGVLLMRQNPQATVTVVTRTDAVGSEETNLEVSQWRANAIVNYWLARGVDESQIKTDPRGEEGASEDDDEATAAASRRAEFIITGLLN
jgi:outer membrane protein OmpA-like peptidoglycan-associated protein